MLWILDLPTEQGEYADTPSPVTSKEEEGDSDNSHVLVNAVGPEDNMLTLWMCSGVRRTRGRRIKRKGEEKKGTMGGEVGEEDQPYG